MLIFQSTPVLSWLIATVLSACAIVISVINLVDRRKRQLIDDVKLDTTESKTVGLLSWTLADRLALEKRLTLIEAEQASQRELHDVMERLMAKVLHSPHRPELDRLLEKIDEGRGLTDAEVMFVVDWLHDILNDAGATRSEKTAAGILLALINRKYKQILMNGYVEH